MVTNFSTVLIWSPNAKLCMAIAIFCINFIARHVFYVGITGHVRGVNASCSVKNDGHSPALLFVTNKGRLNSENGLKTNNAYGHSVAIQARKI